MKKVLLILNHVQAGMGSDENAHIPPAGKKTAIGPGKMMEPFLTNLGGEIIATLYCGDLYFSVPGFSTDIAANAGIPLLLLISSANPPAISPKFG